MSAQCSSKRRCKKCHRKHHTLIHRDNQGVPSVTIKDLLSEVAPMTSSVSMATQKTTQSYYACLPRTMLVMASAGNCRQKARAQLDPGAMLSLVISRLSHSVHAKRIKNSSVHISGVGGDLHRSYQVELKLKSLYTEDFIFIKASVVDDIPACVSPVNMSQIKDIHVFQDLILADPDYSCNCRLNLLLGMVHCNFCSQDGTVFSRDKACKAEKTIFGWAIGGSPQFSSSTHTSASTCLKIAPVQEKIEFLLQRIWAMEEVPGDSNNLTQDEQLAITHFRDTHTRDVDGRYVVSLPRRKPRMELGRSRKTSFRHFLINERSLKKDKWNSFHQGVSEYLETSLKTWENLIQNHITCPCMVSRRSPVLPPS